MAINPFQWLGLGAELTNPNHFQLLEISPSAANEPEFAQNVQRAAQQKLARLENPDLAKYAETVEKLKKRIGTAARVLSDAQKRKVYVEQLKYGNAEARNASNSSFRLPAAPVPAKSTPSQPTTPSNRDEDIPMAIPLHQAEAKSNPIPGRHMTASTSKSGIKTDAVSETPPQPPKLPCRVSENEVDGGFDLPDFQKKSFAAHRRKKLSPWLMLAFSLFVVVSITGLAIVALTLGDRNSSSGNPAAPVDPKTVPENLPKLEDIKLPPPEVDQEDKPDGVLNQTDTEIEVQPNDLEPQPPLNSEEKTHDSALTDNSSRENTNSRDESVALDHVKIDDGVIHFVWEAQFRDLQNELRIYGDQAGANWQDSECARKLNQLRSQFELLAGAAVMSAESVKDLQNCVQVYDRAFANLRGFWQQFEVGAETLRGGSQFKWKNESVAFVEYRDGNIVLRADGASVRYSRRFIPADLAVVIAESGKIEDVPTYRFYLATFLALKLRNENSTREQIEELLKQSIADGHKDTEFRNFLKTLETTERHQTKINLPTGNEFEELRKQTIQRLAGMETKAPQLGWRELWSSALGRILVSERLDLIDLAVIFDETAIQSIEELEANRAVAALEELERIVEFDSAKRILESLFKIASQKLDPIQTLKLKEACASVLADAQVEKNHSALVKQLRNRIQTLETLHQLKGMGQVVGSLR